MRLYTTREYAQLRGIQPETAAKERFVGNGPKFLKIGGRAYYDEEDVRAWLNEKKRSSTSDPGPVRKTA